MLLSMEIFGTSNTYFVGTDVSPYGHLAKPSFRMQPGLSRSGETIYS